MSAIIIEDKIVHYEALGRGRPLVFLHGWVGSWRYWIPSMQSTSVSFRAYALDLWGFGDTEKNINGYDLENQVSLVNKFLDSLGIGKIALIGHGLGAAIAVIFAQKFPDFVDRILAIGLPLNANFIDQRLENANLDELASWILSNTTHGEQALQDLSKTDPQAILQSLNSMKGKDFHNLSRHISRPCLLVQGEEDLAIHSPSPQLLKTLPLHFHHISLEGAGHFPMLDAPNKFNRLMNDFLTLESGQSPRQLQLREEWKRRVR